jgi:glycosyltransferase involved in cell wall biosynthesis
MNILVISPYLPWPLRTGGNAAMFSTLKCLSSDHHFTLVCPVSAEQKNDIAELQIELPDLRICAVDCAVTERSSLLRKVLDRLFRMIRPSVRDVQVEEIPWDPFCPIPRLLAEVIEKEVSRSPDLCQVEFVEMMSIAPLLPPTIPKIFVHHQIHFIYNRLTWGVGKDSAYLKYLIERQRAIEIAYLKEYDALISFSPDDRMTLVVETGIPPVYVSAFPVPADIGIVEEVSSGFNGKFCFLGAQEHPPNRDGLVWLMDEIWPRIAANLKDPELLIFGAWNEDWRRRFESCPGKVTFPGFVPDLGSVIRGGILLVPLRVGSGIRTKILAALAQGVPCVATTIAAEGLPTRSGGGIIRADETASFADAAVDLATRPEFWKTRADAGPEYVSNHHSPEAVRRRRNEIYVDVVKAHQAQKGVA